MGFDFPEPPYRAATSLALLRVGRTDEGSFARRVKFRSSRWDEWHDQRGREALPHGSRADQGGERSGTGPQ